MGTGKICTVICFEMRENVLFWEKIPGRSSENHLLALYRKHEFQQGGI